MDSYTPLTPEQFQAAIDAGFTPDQITQHEMTRKAAAAPPPEASPAEPLMKYTDKVPLLRGIVRGVDSALSSGTDKAVQAVKDLRNNPGFDAKISALMDLMGGAAKPYVIPAALANAPAMLANPVSTMGGIAGGLLGGYGAGQGAQALGAGPGITKVAQTGGGILGGVAGGTAGDLIESKLGGLLQDLAKTQYGRVINPTTQANKAAADEVVPEMIKRGITGNTIKGMASDAADRVDAASKVLDAAWGAPGGAKTAPVPIGPALQQMQTIAKEKYLSPTGVPYSDPSNRAYNMVQNLSQRILGESKLDAAGNRVVPAGVLRSYRQDWDQIINNAGGFGKSLSDQTTAGATEIGANALRNTINTNFPAVQSANQEYHLQKTIQDLIDATALRRQGQSVPMGQQLTGVGGTIVGGMIGGPGGALIGRQVGKSGQAALSSPFYNTRAAIAKDRLGGLLQQAPALPLWMQGLLGNIGAK